MASAGGRAAGAQRVLAKLQESLSNEKYYEAHQMYRTLYFRYSSQKRYPELLDLLYDGATKLLLKNQQGSGADLAILFVDVLTTANSPTSEENFQKISHLFQLINSSAPERDTYLVKALRWSGMDETKKGHPQLHKAIAQVFWKEKNYFLARFHFMHSPDGRNCAKMLVELHVARGFSNEVDLFIAQAVLQYLCLQNKNAAVLAFTSYTANHPNIMKRNPPFIMPLLNFLWFLLQAIESGKLAIFKMLCDKYRPSLGRDPSYQEYLDKIAQIFFGVRPPPNSRPRGLFDNLLQQLLGGADDDSDEEGASASSSSGQKSQPMETEMD
ncbi:Golgi to ER traffic protein 4 homolog [Neocloeon triangulifer]|uniref:Golgi to ER traffic protein 4 homolog n=1 Tax=Neocloeon triangulifer TaxID=2078957 RepID=UPI00286F550B|nr:Golgi to ER traffic protein 4 homolog [Neocloeon triangulifer]